MSAAASARVLAIGTTWRLTGLPAAGRALVTAAAAAPTTEQALAGMLLVRAGDRSVPLVSEAIRTGRAPAGLVDVLASIDSDDARAALRRLSQAPPPHVPREASDAAATALRTLDEIRRQDRGDH